MFRKLVGLCVHQLYMALYHLYSFVLMFNCVRRNWETLNNPLTSSMGNAKLPSKINSHIDVKDVLRNPETYTVYDLSTGIVRIRLCRLTSSCLSRDLYIFAVQ